MSCVVMRFPGGKQKAFTMSYDDGLYQDIRLLDIMKKNKLKGTFNLNSGCYAQEERPFFEAAPYHRLSYQQASKLYQDSGMEVAIHGWHHPYLDQLPPTVCMEEVMQDRLLLEKQFGTLVRGLAYPNGTYSDTVVEILRQCGVVYARTVEPTNKTVINADFAIPTDWLRWKVTCHHDDPDLMRYAQKFVTPVSVCCSPWLFLLWGHSCEFDVNHNWETIENFVQFIGNRDDIWYATNIEIYDYVSAYRQLIFSGNGSNAYNPTTTDVYLVKDTVAYKIGAGETVFFLS